MRNGISDEFSFLFGVLLMNIAPSWALRMEFSILMAFLRLPLQIPCLGVIFFVSALLEISDLTKNFLVSLFIQLQLVIPSKALLCLEDLKCCLHLLIHVVGREIQFNPKLVFILLSKYCITAHCSRFIKKEMKIYDGVLKAAKRKHERSFCNFLVEAKK